MTFILPGGLGQLFATPGFSNFNPLDKSANITLSNNNLTATASGAVGLVRGTKAQQFATGKFYFEVTMNVVDSSSTQYSGVGVANASASLTSFLGADANAVALVAPAAAGRYYGQTNATQGFTTGTIATAGDIIMVACDTSASAWLYFGVNGTWVSGNPSTGTGAYYSFNAPYFPAVSCANGAQFTINVGKTAFAYALPTAHVAWG